MFFDVFYMAIMYPHINIATTIITNTNLCFVLNVILFPRFHGVIFTSFVTNLGITFAFNIRDDRVLDFL